MFHLFCVLQVTSIASDPDLGLTIISCFISPNSNPSVPSDYTLIETVCPTDDSVRFYPQRGFPVLHSQMDKKSFSFTFNSKFNMSLLFLHCEMSMCTKRSQSNQRLPPVCSIIFCTLLPFFCMFDESLLWLIWAILYRLQLSPKTLIDARVAKLPPADQNKLPCWPSLSLSSYCVFFPALSSRLFPLPFLCVFTWKK